MHGRNGMYIHGMYGMRCTYRYCVYMACMVYMVCMACAYTTHGMYGVCSMHGMVCMAAFGSMREHLRAFGSICEHLGASGGILWLLQQNPICMVW